jgi:hypothetical protein
MSPAGQRARPSLPVRLAVALAALGGIALARLWRRLRRTRHEAPGGR